MELVMLGRVNLDGDDRKPKVVVTNAAPSGDPVLDVALQSLIDKGPVKPSQAIGVLGKGLREKRLNDALATRGILRRESGRILGLFPTTRWPAQDQGHRRASGTPSPRCWSRTWNPIGRRPRSSRC